MIKAEMLDRIDSLICCLRGADNDIENLIDSRIEWMDIDDLTDYYYNTMFSFYKTHTQDFMEDYCQEFIDE